MDDQNTATVWNMVLKQLSDLNASMNELRQEIHELKAELAELLGKDAKVDEVK